MKEYDNIFMPMRLQPPHLGHIEIIKKASQLSNRVNILIYTTKNQDINNPLTAKQRKTIIEYSLNQLNLKNIKITIMPYFEDNDKRFEFVYENKLVDNKSAIISGDEFIKKEFEKRGNTLINPYDITHSVKEISAGKIRDLILKGNNEWKSYAASGTLHYYEEFKLKETLKYLRGRQDINKNLL